MVATVLLLAVLTLAPTAQAKPDAAGPEIPPAVKDGQLTLRAKDRPVRWLLTEIAREARVSLTVDPEISDARLSVDFRDFPVDEALRQLLTEYDAFYFYGSSDESPARLQVLWVYPKGKGAGLHPTPPEQWASTEELKERLASADREARMRSIESLVQRLGQDALEEILRALQDSDEKVRAMALHEAADNGVELPDSVVLDLAFNDRAPAVRFLAMQALASREEMKWVAERLVNDPDRHVSAGAHQILDRWERVRRKREAPGAASGEPSQQPLLQQQQRQLQQQQKPPN